MFKIRDTRPYSSCTQTFLLEVKFLPLCCVNEEDTDIQDSDLSLSSAVSDIIKQDCDDEEVLGFEDPSEESIVQDKQDF